MPGRQLINPILHPAPRTMFHVYQVVYLDKLNVKFFVPKKNPCLGYVKSPRFHGNPFISVFE